MRLLHTADWHLGRVFYGSSLLEDQRLILEQVIEAVAVTQPDALIIAGDLYDRAVPPPEAVALLDDVLSRIVIDARVPVFAIAGNHDSPDRTEFLGRLLSEGNLHLQGRVRVGDAAPTILMDEHGPLAIHLIPFAEPSIVDELLAEELLAEGGTTEDARGRTKVGKERRYHGDALRALLARARRAHPKGMRAVVVAHGSVVGGQQSESERPLAGGQSAFVDASDFAGICYTALGHFHRPQTFDDDGACVRYAGSPLSYSFSEEGQEKSLTVIDIEKDGTTTIALHALHPRRQLRTLRGSFAELLALPDNDDFVRAVITDPTPVLDATGRLRQRHHNLVAVEHERLRVQTQSPRVNAAAKLSDEDLFHAFVVEVTGHAPTADEKRALGEFFRTRDYNSGSRT